MLIILKNLIIYLNILLCTCAPLPNNNEVSTIINFKHEVQMEMASFEDLLNEFKGAGSNKDKVEGKILGKLKGVVNRAIKADLLLVNQGHLEEQKNEASKYKLLLALTYRIDYLESLLAPGSDFRGKQRRARWSTIFRLKTPAVEEIKQKIKDAGMTELVFAECIEKLCNERNTRAGHAKISLPKILNEKIIQEALAIMEIADDKSVVNTIKIIAAPVEASDLTTTPKSILITLAFFLKKKLHSILDK